tara:strand:+ start:31 stop:969 length:939 start_codon:yes stop_codon:yes gene_type:complete
MIIVTGGLGFIGSSIANKLRELNDEEILIVDDFKKGKKFLNLNFYNNISFVDSNSFYDSYLKNINPKKIKAIFHQGACTNTTEWDGELILRKNLNSSISVFNFAKKNNIRFIYASSASVYGTNNNFEEIKKNEKPINLYALSKLIFDNYVRSNSNKKTRYVGLRYFNVYGPKEFHKDNMSSPILKFYQQYKKNKTINLFKGTNDIKNGEQKRDFIYIKDVVDINLWFLNNSHQGIFNVGTGKASSFNDIASCFMNSLPKCKKKYVKFPEVLIGSYQNYTCANIRNLRNIGYKKKFIDLEKGILEYIKILKKS